MIDEVRFVFRLETSDEAERVAWMAEDTAQEGALVDYLRQHGCTPPSGMVCGGLAVTRSGKHFAEIIFSKK